MRSDKAALWRMAGFGAAALMFSLLVIAVRVRWVPLVSLDRDVAHELNELVAPSRFLVMLMGAISRLGSFGVLAWLVVIGATLLIVRKRYRLAGFLLATTVGGLLLDPSLKLAVGRLRPVVEQPVAYGGGNSFPSGHALGSFVCYAALLLVFLPAFPRAWRRTVVIVVGAVVALIGFSRLALGVHFMTDVIGAWSLGVAWVGLCAAAFELIRHEQGRRVTEPLTEGLEPEAAADLRPTEPHEPPAAPARGGATRAGAALRAGTIGSVGLAARPDTHAAPRTDASRTDASRTDAGRTDAGRTDATRTDVTRTVGRRTDAGRAGQTGGADAKGSEGPHGGHGRLWVAAGLAVAWVLTFGALVGLGVPLAKYRNGNGNILGDSTIPHWFAAHRADALARISIIGSEVGNTHAILAIGLVVGAVALAAVRRWRPVVFLVTVMFGELTLFLSTAALVGRDRPDVENMDGPMPTSSYPSGHVAATICIWTVIALLVVPRTRAWWRWLFVAAAVLMPLWVAVSRMYRGMHHPTDILGSCLLAAVWVAAAWWLMRPNADRDEPPARTRKTLQTTRS